MQQKSKGEVIKEMTMTEIPMILKVYYQEFQCTMWGNLEEMGQPINFYKIPR